MRQSMRQRFSGLDTITDPRVSHVMVRSATGAGYWGRGLSVGEAIANAQWLGSQSKVYVCQCDSKAHCDPVTGDLWYTSRGPIYSGKVMRDRKDVLVTAMVREAKLDP